MTTLTIDPMLMADLSATCNNLGYLDDATGKYQKEPECLECMKDIIRYLRQDDENHEIRRALGETKVVVKDLIPIIKHHSSDMELLDVALRLLVNLTTPALILYEEELPGERISRRYYLEVVQYLQSYKEAFSDKVFWSVLATKMTALLEKDWEERMEDDRLMIERILILVRNVLHIPANPAAEKRTDDDASVHDQVLWALHLAHVDDIILFIAQSDDEQHLCIHVLEVVSLMLREQDGKQLARSGATRSLQERQKDIQELEQIRRQEHDAKQRQMRKLSNLRHTRFGGTFRVQNMSSISERDLIYHRPLAQINELSFDREKVPRKTPKNRLPLADGETTRRSMLTIRLFLQQFCAELLAGAYNKIMRSVKDDLARAKAQAHDESYYMWAVKFFMEFNRYHHFRVDRISETLSVSMFHYIQTQLETHLEMMASEKRKIKIWSKRAHLALRAYQELLFTIQHMDACRDEGTHEAARVLKSNLFYMPEYRELLYVLLCQYSPVKMSRKFLTDLVETTHVFIKLLEKFSGAGRIVVKQKRKAKKASSRRPAPGAPAADRQAPTVDLESAWDGLSDELSAALQGDRPLPDDVRPIDAASEVPVQEQRVEAMLRIQDLLRAGQATDALALIRAAREVWPEGDAFGAADITQEDEFLALREIHFIELPGRDQQQRPPQPQEERAPTQDQPDDDDEEEEEAIVEEREQEFDFKDFIKRFMTVKVLEPYCALLRHFDSNTAEANHCVLKMLHRVVWDHKMPAILFQASVFRTFQRLLAEDSRHYHSPAFKELIRFAKYVLRAFFKVAETNKKVFMELLFWKSAREAYELEHGYDSFQDASKMTKLAWSEEEEDELSRIYEELRDTENTDPERDLLDRIVDTLICRERTRRQVAKKLKQLGLIQDVRQLRRPGRGTAPPRQWSDSEVAELRRLWQSHCEASDPLTMIMDHLSLRRPKNRIRDQLLELGLVTDRKQLYKKRGSGRGRPAPGSEDGDICRGSGISSDEDAHAPRASQPSAARRPVKKQRRPAAARSKSAPTAVSRGQLTAAVRSYLQSGDDCREVATWLQESLAEARALRLADPEEPVPLVALSETCAAALETDTARALLATLGAQAPGDGEMFWRWPAALPADVLGTHADTLAACLHGGDAAPDAEPSSDKESHDRTVEEAADGLPGRGAGDGDDTPRRTAARRCRWLSSDDESSVDVSSSQQRSQDDQFDRTPASISTPATQRSRASRMTSDSEEETAAAPPSTTQRSRVSRMTSDSEEETAAAPPSTTQRSRVSRMTSDSEEETAAAPPSTTQRSRVSRMTSDSEEETAAAPPSTTQRSRVSRMTSDSEEETAAAPPSTTQRSRVSRMTSDSEEETAAAPPSTTQRSRVSRMTSDPEEETAAAPPSTTQRSRVSRMTSDSEEETAAATPSTTQRSRVSRMTSDSEEETAAATQHSRVASDCSDRQQSQRVDSVVSESGFKQAVGKRLLSSDDEASDADAPTVLHAAQKRAKRVIESDSE